MKALVSQDEAQKSKAPAYTGTRTNALARCKFCGGWVNLDDEGNTYRDGSSAHEECADSDTFNRENASDFRD